MEGLSPKAANRVAREAAVQTFDPAARAINMDWGTSYDGKLLGTRRGGQIQRWGEALGQAVVSQREAQREAAHPQDETGGQQWAGSLKDLLWDGRVEQVIEQWRGASQRVGPPQEGDGPQHPRRVLAQNVGYFERHAPHMKYPEYRSRGWPIASGVTESGVKLFNKRVKGTEQFWNTQGVEPILALRALWLSEDQRWAHYWSCTTPRKKAA